MAKNTKRKDGRLQSKVYIGNGKYKYVYAKTQRDLNDKVRALKNQLDKGIDVISDKDTFGDWANRWLLTKQHTVSYNRYKTWQCRVNNLKDLFDYPVSKIRSTDIQTIIYNYKNKGYAPSTIAEIKSCCNQIMQLAVNNRIIDYNPTTCVTVPQRVNNSKRRALTPEEQKWIESETDNRCHIIAMIMMHAGLRRGEVIPLLWSDIDLDNKTITVNKAVEFVNGKAIVKNQTKTAAGMRVVYIPQRLVDYLNKQPKTNFLVCTSAKGAMLTLSAFKRLWNSYLAELNFKFGDFSKIVNFEKPKSRFAPVKIPFVIDKITPHWLRHTFITNMYLAGIDVLTAKEQAGHADISTTMSIYTHLDSVHKTKQITKMDEYLKSLDKTNDNMGVNMGVKKVCK